ncbi:hypothetical protein DN400_24940 [Bacillus sp. AR8-1]|nr:hypothetical protein C6A34_00460 [Bacillus thuringiensis]PWN16249.1 hypothetical protein CU072_07540 [Bacillus thuringiensis]TXR70367.1 hypothetical protein DN400_24940 [Bacillus sp. AR8-1]
MFLSYQWLNISFYYVSGKILFRMLGVLYEKRYKCLWDDFLWAVTFQIF